VAREFARAWRLAHARAASLHANCDPDRVTCSVADRLWERRCRQAVGAESRPPGDGDTVFVRRRGLGSVVVMAHRERPPVLHPAAFPTMP
jgi:hypothetical protein